jgi:hypothetical protein
VVEPTGERVRDAGESPDVSDGEPDTVTLRLSGVFPRVKRMGSFQGGREGGSL